MAYTPFDDRDRDLDEWLAQQAQTQRPELDAVPTQGNLAALIQPRDAEMDSRWRTAEQGALSRSGYGGNQEYGAGEAVRDFAPLAVGGVLDVLLNKGKGLGYLSGAAMQANAQTAKTRQAEAQAAGDFALSARHQREANQGSGLDAAYKQAQIENWQANRDLGWARVGQRDQQIDLAQAKAQFDRDPTNPQAQQIRQLVLQQTNGAVDLAGLGTQNQGRLMGVVGRVQGAELAGPTAAAQTQATIDTQLANAPAVNQNEADKAAAKAAAEKAATNPALDASGNPLAPQGTSVGAGSYAELAKRDPAAAQKIRESDQDVQAMLQSHTNLTNIRAQIDQLPLKQRTVSDPTFAKLQGQWDDEVKRYQTLQFQAQNRGVPQAFEQKIFDVKVGNPYSWESALKDPLDAAVSARTDQGAMMAGQHEAMLQAQQQFRQKWGFSPQQAQPQQPSAAPAGGGWGSNVQENLGTTSGRVPAIPGQRSASVQTNTPSPAPTAPSGGLTFRPSGMPDGSVYVTDSNGVTKRVRREQAIAAGWGGQ